MSTREHSPVEVAATAMSPCEPSRTGLLQRKCACGGTPGPTGECADCRKKRLSLRRRSIGAEPGEIPPIVHQVLRASGQPLDPATRAFMEARFGHDFSQVRVHADDKAAESAQAMSALAYTVGRDVVFGAGRYEPGTSEGRQLLAHELTHVVQQHSGQSGVLQKQSEEAGDQLEGEAEAMATRVVAATPAAKQAAKKPRAATNPCTRTILAEGTCKHLVLRAAGRCCDPDNGIEHPSKTTDVEGKPCPSKRFTPMFTCDHDCKTAVEKGCDDDDTWMAIPKDQFSRSKCGDLYTICANGKQTTGYVRDKSETETSFEVSPGIQKILGVTVGGSFQGAIYRPGAKQVTIDKDPCCKSSSEGAPDKRGQAE